MQTEEKQLESIQSETANLNQVERNRRTLTEALSDASADVAREQQAIAALAEHLADPGNESIERQLADARSRLKKVNEVRARAANALEAFDRKNPTAQQLQARQEELEAQQGQLEQGQIVEQMKGNIRQSFALLFQLEKLQDERAAIYKTAVDRWPATEPGRVRHAGFPKTMTAWFPSLFDGYGQGELRAALELAAEWHPDLVPESHPARVAVAARTNETPAAYFRAGINIGNV
jgi:hypothetical protein